MRPNRRYDGIAVRAEGLILKSHKGASNRAVRGEDFWPLSLRDVEYRKKKKKKKERERQRERACACAKWSNDCVYINFARYTVHNVARHLGDFIKPCTSITAMGGKVNQSEREGGLRRARSQSKSTRERIVG